MEGDHQTRPGQPRFPRRSDEQEAVTVGLVGLGYWGPNLLRGLTELQDVNVFADSLRVDNSVMTDAKGREVRLPYLKLPRNPDIQNASRR